MRIKRENKSGIIYNIVLEDTETINGVNVIIKQTVLFTYSEKIRKFIEETLEKYVTFVKTFCSKIKEVSYVPDDKSPVLMIDKNIVLYYFNTTKNIIIRDTQYLDENIKRKIEMSINYIHYVTGKQPELIYDYQNNKILFNIDNIIIEPDETYNIRDKIKLIKIKENNTNKI